MTIAGRYIHAPDAMRRVIVESPYAGEDEAKVAENETYARAALRDCLRRGEAPIASHLLYTQPGVLDDTDPDERRQGIDAGLAWGDIADAVVVYTDLGISNGMKYGIERHKDAGRHIEYRSIEEHKKGAIMSAEIIPFPEKPRPKADGCFGLCPHCGDNDGYLNIERCHWFYCEWHKTTWMVGTNLFSSWQHEDEETWKRNEYRLAEYMVVEPYYPPHQDGAA